MKDIDKPTHLGPYKCRKCKGDKFKWVKRYNKDDYWTRSCVPCRAISENKSVKKLKDKDYYSQWQLANKQRLREYQKEYYKGKHGARNALYQKRVKQRTLPNEDLSLIKEFYLQCPGGYEVDHIIPLNGKNISGLHTLSNLQYLPASDNRRKSNKF